MSHTNKHLRKGYIRLANLAYKIKTQKLPVHPKHLQCENVASGAHLEKLLQESPLACTK